MTGTVKWFNSKRGIGFITGEDSNDYFVHFSGILKDGFKSLKNSENVEFDVEQAEKGAMAVNVKEVSA